MKEKGIGGFCGFSFRGFNKVRPQVIVQSPRLRRIRFIAAYFLNFPGEYLPLSVEYFRRACLSGYSIGPLGV